MVGLLAGKGLALASGKPLIAVNHLEGHALSPRLVDPDLDFPICCCSCRAGIANCSKCAGSATIAASRRRSTMPPAKRSTKRRSCSACPIPAARRSKRWRRDGDPKAVPLPRPLLGSPEPHFSFAGLKSAVQRAVASGTHKPADIAASLPAGGGRLPGRPHRPRARAKRRADPGRRRRRRRQQRGARGLGVSSPRVKIAPFRCRRAGCAPTMRR